MQKIINFLRGSVGLEITGAFPERYLNLCAQNRVSFWGVERCSGQVLRLTVARQNLRQAYALGERAECAVTETAARGVPAFLVRFRRRYALLAGLACSLLAVCIFSQFVLTVEVTGNVTVPTAQILGELQRAGVRPGVYGPGIDLAEVGQLMPLRMQELSWCAVNLRGTVAEVLVRERVKKPKLADESRLGDVVAEAPGIITKMEVLEGEPSCKPGDTVLAGEVLIAGNIHMEAPAYSNTDLGWRQVQAQGRIYARTWRTLQAKIPMHATVKVPTGAEITRWSGEVLGLRVNFYGNAGISFAKYDKIDRVWNAVLPGGQRLPCALRRETLREYTPATAPIDPDGARELLTLRLEQALREQLAGGAVVSSVCTAKEADGTLTLTLRAECREEIGRFVPFN